MISHRRIDTYSWSEKQVEALVENSLIGLIAKAEALQKLVCKTHHLVHSNIILLQTLHINTIQCCIQIVSFPYVHLCRHLSNLI